MGGGKRTFPRTASRATIEEMMKEIENFNPDRYKDFPLWWPKEKYMEKISRIDKKQEGRTHKAFIQAGEFGLRMSQGIQFPRVREMVDVLTV